jgi:amino acid adenylation domain-containing protein/non-ribosomal peptide synthase protein (TIGR01720 family)
VRKVIGRHEILRTSFRCRPDMVLPLQVIAQDEPLDWDVVDISDVDARIQHEQLSALRQAALPRRRSISDAPALHARLAVLGRMRHVLLMTLPALCADTVSLDLLTADVARAYCGSACEVALPPDVIQYADYAEFQNELLEADEREACRAFWRMQGVYPPPRSLSLGRPGRPKADFLAGELRTNSRSNRAERATRLSREWDVHRGSLWLASWAMLVWRLGDGGDVLLGLCGDGRRQEDLQSTFGLLARHVPLRLTFDGPPLFRDLVHSADRLSAEACAFQDYFVWDLIGSRDDPVPPFFPVCFEHVASRNRHGNGVTSFQLVESAAHIDRFLVKLLCFEVSHGVNFTLAYDRNELSEHEAAQVLRMFETVTDQLLHCPTMDLREVALLDEIAREKIWGHGVGPVPAAEPPLSVVAAIEQEAARHADRAAVICGGEKLSYRELNARADRIAHLLHACGAARDSVVGVCGEHAMEVVVGILGILKAGAAYLPLDASWPQPRLSAALAAGRVCLVLRSDRLAPVFADSAVVATLPLELSIQDTSTGGGVRSQAAIDPDQLAYAIFTSGSSGTPKGVMISHRSLAHSTASRSLYYGCKPQKFLLVSPFVFDSSVAGLFWTLCEAGTLVFARPGDEGDLAALADLIGRERVTHLLCLPSLYGALLEYAGERRLDSLRTVIVAGEVCLSDVVSEHFRRLPCTALFNEYGPTEAAVWSSVHACAESDASTVVPIGRPPGHAQLFVLDRYMQLVPAGVPGELYIGGCGLARGYLQSPALTAARFVPHPFAPGGKRLYKTGDRVRWRPDGELEFLGWRDHQVKIRGHRIELGEIEAALLQHPGVREAAVVARGGATPPESSATMRLAAFIAANRAEVIDENAVRRHLQRCLPTYMAPHFLVVLERLPRTATGKIDRTSLQLIDVSSFGRRPAYNAPSTPIEEALARIWAEVLGADRVGVDDNFFALGGDSILSIQVVSRARAAGITCTPLQIFHSRTLGQLASVATTILAPTAEQREVVGPVPLSPIQRWFFAQDTPNPHHFNQSVLLDLPGRPQPQLLAQAVRALAAHHDALRLRFERTAAGWQAVQLPIATTQVPFDRIELGGRAADEQQRLQDLRITEIQRGLHLEKGPLWRAAYFDLGSERRPQLLLAAHHLVVDGVSWRILLEDLHIAYEQLRLGTSVQLLPETTSFKQWTERLCAHAGSPTCFSEVDYWGWSVAGDRQAIPADRCIGPNTFASAEAVVRQEDEAWTRTLLRDLAPGASLQINDVLLTALADTWRRVYGRSSLLLDVEGHGRTGTFADLDLSRTVGWFTCAYPLRLDWNPATDLGALLVAVKSRLRSVPREGLGWGQLRYLSADAAAAPLRSAPAREVCFNYFGRFDANAAMDAHLIVDAGGPLAERCGEMVRPYLLEVNAFVQNGCFRSEWTYSRHFQHRHSVEQLADTYHRCMHELVDYALRPDRPIVVPADFPLARINSDELQRILQHVEGDGSGL